ncbi:inter alpha-trypsin inhibitor, heavy chain 4 isoform X2 [Carica papaya]|uniref:inter alpha-trypsin inhibitor, heavy chain 4 isoform X2 n=1 Tax=Carica papaya TaxID=3649 RepID=UPI000B8C92C0|nr:inter alpha-trypsin inhibitor, heavy chain 4 isoform X2 [Carica papaya]
MARALHQGWREVRLLHCGAIGREGVEVDIHGSGRSYNTILKTTEDVKDLQRVPGGGYGGFLKSHIYTVKIPLVGGGSLLSIRVDWSQRLLYQDGQFLVNVPFSFPAYVIPVGKQLSKREKILLNVNSGIGREILCKCTSHPLKEINHNVGKLSFLYEAEVPAWSNVDFSCSYSISSNDFTGGVLLKSPSVLDFDEREMFCLYLLPGANQHRKVFKREVIFLIDISRSMEGAPLDEAKNALIATLSKLNPQDSFNILGFNEEIYSFSSSMELATQEKIANATQWLSNNLLVGDGTNILLPLQQAMKLLGETTDTIPLIFLITDGAVEDEIEVCNVMKSYLTSERSTTPRICTFGIGLYCNHYFLQMLAQLGRGHYESAYDADSVEFRMQRLFTAASSVIAANIVVDALKHLDSIELFPFLTPDLTSGCPLIISGRYEGDFLDSVKVSGIMGDMNEFTTELKVQRTKEIPLDKVLAKRQIDILTAHAWFSGSKELEEKVAKISLQTGFPSEYTNMVFLKSEIENGKKVAEPMLLKEVLGKINLQKKIDMSSQKMILLGSLGVGFGNLIGTAKNFPPGKEEPKSPEGAQILVKAATSCCSRLLDRVCCMCFIQSCSYMNDQCIIVYTQLCAGLACFECLNCCFDLWG